MATPKWQMAGEYFEACNCDFLCPCITSNLSARPTSGECKVALAFHIDKGEFDGAALDGLNFVVVIHAPGAMAAGNMTAGLIVDERASPAQQNALGAIVSGQAGGPLAALGPLIGKFAGVEVRPIRWDKQGMRYAVEVPGLVNQAVEGLHSAADPAQPIAIDNVFHPVTTRLALAKPTRAHLHAFGIDWDAAAGSGNGHFAPFSWAA
jgi:hypothetical protein